VDVRATLLHRSSNNQASCGHIRGYVVDLPDVVDEAIKNARHLGIPENRRIEFIKHDFTKPFPSHIQLQVDTVVFKNILYHFIHDKKQMMDILRNCRSIFPREGGRLLIIDGGGAGDLNVKVGVNGLQQGFLSTHVLSTSDSVSLSNVEWVENLTEIGIKSGYEFKRVYDTFSGGLSIFELACNAIG